MPLCEFSWPTSADPTKWTPTQRASISSERTVDLGWLQQVMPDGQTIFTYNLRPRSNLFKLHWNVLTDADFDNFLTFVDAQRGDSFDMIAPVTGGAYFHVKFDGDPMIGWRSIEPNRWTVDMALRQSL